MSLLEEIQKEAIDSNGDLGALLRKCKLLAVRLQSQPLEDWLLWESNGYPADIKVPDYRVWELQVKGHFSGPFQSGIRNAYIPRTCLPDEAREQYENYQCRESVATIEQFIKSSDKGMFQVSTGDLAVVLGSEVYKGQFCLQAWAEFGRGNFLELLNSVRNRVLDFSLAIWKEEPNAGNASSETGTILEPSRVTQIFNTTVYGGSANLLGTANNSQITVQVIYNDLGSLEQALRENSVSEEDLSELKAALKEDEPPTTKDKFGPRVSAWIGGMIRKSAEGGWRIGVGAAGGLLAQFISKYYGL